MDMKGLQAYKVQSINTMTKEELLLLVYDELVTRLHRCDLALGVGNIALFESTVDRCMDIVHYLDDTLDRRFPVSRDLHKLYEFFCYELNRIKIGRNKNELDNIRPMVAELRDTFREAAKKSAERK